MNFRGQFSLLYLLYAMLHTGNLCNLQAWPMNGKRDYHYMNKSIWRSERRLEPRASGLRVSASDHSVPWVSIIKVPFATVHFKDSPRGTSASVSCTCSTVTLSSSPVQQWQGNTTPSPRDAVTTTSSTYSPLLGAPPRSWPTLTSMIYTREGR